MSIPKPADADIPDAIVKLDLALRLIRNGVRPPIASRLTALPNQVVRKLWESHFHTPAPRGQFPPDSTRILSRTGIAEEGALWLAIYRRICYYYSVRITSRVHATALLDAYRTLRIVLSQQVRLTLQQTYFIARDLVTGTLETRYCTTCRAHYLYHLPSTLISCPFCAAQKKPGAKKRRV